MDQPGFNIVMLIETKCEEETLITMDHMQTALIIEGLIIWVRLLGINQYQAF